MRVKLLFVCSANQWRSPTAEALFKRSQHYDARSGGTSEGARVKVTERHILWADRIFVMENRHRSLLQQSFQPALTGKPLDVLDIPDDYSYMDPDLIELLQARLSPYLPELEWPP